MKRSKELSDCTIENLLEELLIDILSRLSVKTIVTCRCVSKTWRNLLSSSNTSFTKFHFNRSPVQFIIPNLHYRKFFMYLVELEDDTAFYSTDFYSLKLLRTKFQLSSFTLFAVNSCNGFVCLASSQNGFNPVKVCNPITGEYLNLPDTKLDYYLDSCVLSGFGCSAKTNQYKVVRMVRKDMMVEVYTIGTKSWRTIGTARKFSERFGCTTFFNGIIHWLCHDNLSSDCIVSFDLESEKFCIVPPPPHFSAEPIQKSYRYKKYIGVLGEFFYVIHNVELWVMKEYGVQESWTKVCVVDRPFETLQAIKYLSGGKILLNHRDWELISYDPVKKISKEFKPLQICWTLETIAHVPSFMSFNDAMMGDKGTKLRTRMCRV